MKQCSIDREENIGVASEEEKRFLEAIQNPATRQQIMSILIGP